MRTPQSAILQVAAVLLFGCDTSVETVAETPAPSPSAQPSSAPAPEQAEYVAMGRVDLQAVVDGVADGSVKSAAELETKLSGDAVANVDIDADGVRDELRVVEKREDKATVFELHALPSAKVKAEAKGEAHVEVAAAPVVAVLRFDAHADLGNVVARASFSDSFVASAKLTANVNVEHTFTGVSVSTEGLMTIDAKANAFVAWTFRPRRPVFVAEVFVIAHAPTPEPDPCWPPGHCKHGFWKATGEEPPGHEKKEHDDHFRGDDHGRVDVDIHIGKPEHDKPDHAKADHAKAEHHASTGKDKGGGDKHKGGGGKGKGK
jgi:hypothetical protein